VAEKYFFLSNNFLNIKSDS